MAVEIIVPPPDPTESNFDSASTSPFISAPSSPSYYRRPAAKIAIPFGWEEKPGIPKSTAPSSAASSNYGDAEDELDYDGGKEFAFDFSGQSDREPLPADELFDGGRIKPLKPPPRFQYDQPGTPPTRSPRSPGKFIREAFSPKNRSTDFDPFAAAMKQTRRDGSRQNADERKRGRAKKISRSLSPFRVSDLLFEPDPAHGPKKSPFSSVFHRRWRIKDLLLFRSASEGRPKDKDIGPTRYSMLRRAGQDDVIRDSSFMSTESVGSGSSRRRTGHYTGNRQFSEDRKRTFLPYKQGFLGCLGFLPGAQDHFPAMGIISATGSLSRG